MLKQTITFKDYNDHEVTETLYFNLTQPEIIEMELSIDNGLSELLQRIIATEDHGKLITEFKRIILAAYGERSADGRYFRKKNAEGVPLSIEFEQSAAYEAYFMMLATDADKAATFFNGIIPKDAIDAAQQRNATKAPVAVPVDPQDPAFAALQAQANESRSATQPLPPPPGAIAG